MPWSYFAVFFRFNKGCGYGPSPRRDDAVSVDGS